MRKTLKLQCMDWKGLLKFGPGSIGCLGYAVDSRQGFHCFRPVQCIHSEFQYWFRTCGTRS